MVFLLIAEEVLPINQVRALGGPGTIVESVDKLGRLHSFPLGREIAIAEEVGRHLGDRGVGARILHANVPRYWQSGDSLGINGGTQTERSELPVQLGIEHPAQRRLIAIDVCRFQGPPASIAVLARSTVGGIDEEQMGMDMRIGMTAGLVDVFGRDKISRWLSDARTGVVLPVSQAFNMVEQVHDRDPEGSLDRTGLA